MSWPPLTSQLRSENISLSSLLHHFLNILLHDDADKPLTTKVSFFAQDLLYAVNKGRHLTPKHILLPFTIKLLTGNEELIEIINRLGHGVSYSKVSELDTAFAIQKLSQSTVIIPDEVHHHIPISLVYDNTDRLEETLSGAGRTHKSGRNCYSTIYWPNGKLPHMALLLNQNAKASMLHPSNYRSTNVGPDLSHLLQQRYCIKNTHLNGKTH